MYVIKNDRLKNYLYSLGFNYNVVTDKTGKQQYIYLFKQSIDLFNAITFYTINHQKQAKNLSVPF